MNEKPLGDDPVSIEFLTLIGRVVVTFSKLERSIDIALARARKFAKPRHYPRGNPPISLSRKIDALLDVCRAIPAIREHVEWIDKNLKSLEKLSEDRNVIIHGYCHGLTIEGEPTAHFRLARYKLGKTEETTLFASRGYIENLIRAIERADYNFFMIMLIVIQETQKRS